jgi:type II secretory ATPase GspE/PulE/Tfp pilus assembly ATPase PilB-like protein
MALVPCGQGDALSVRLLDPRRLERVIDNLGLTDANLRQMEEWLEDVNGMFLASGPTGCGKTTTVYALLHELKYADRRVVSIEDPIEYSIPGITQVQLDEKHHLSFAGGVKAALRLDPDFLMIGEIRDSASAHAAVDASITGRVLLSTLHSKDAVGAITALRNWGLPDHEISESLAVVVAQRLVRRLCQHCRVESAPSDAERQWLRALRLKAPKTAWAATGCKECNQLGFLGRTGIFELWRLEESDYQLILGHADEHTLRRQFAGSGRIPLLQDGLAKVAAGITSLAELRRAGAGAFPCQSLNKSAEEPEAGSPSSASQKNNTKPKI